jgi:hypothetical protein
MGHITYRILTSLDARIVSVTLEEPRITDVTRTLERVVAVHE